MDYKKLMKQYHVDMLDVLKRFILIPSVYDEKTKTKDMPFGKDVNDALTFMARLGERYGYDVDRCDGYATEITIGEGEKLISIFAHADVVPAPGEWKYGPFNPVVEDNNLYGRGTSDDKGPLIAAFYAAKALYDNSLIKNTRIRFVVGGDEERGSSCLHHYFEVLKKEEPTYGFTPDSDFPLIYGEKGITDFHVRKNIVIPNVKSIKGGVVTNAVCDKVLVEMDKGESFISYLKDNNVEFEQTENGLIFLGKAVHGSTPQFGKNAALIALEMLGKYYNVDELNKIGSELSDTTGKAFDLYSHSELLGDTTYCVGIISYENNELYFTVNFRYNENVKPELYKANFDHHFNVESTMKEPSNPLLFDPKCDLVSTLLKAYRLETNDMSAPLTSGGGTYAKHAKNTIAFGALFPNRESTMHEIDEYINLDEFYLSSAIYAHAIKLLIDL